MKDKNKLRNQVYERYSASRLQEPEEILQYNHNFTTLGHQEDGRIENSGSKEYRIKPARLNSTNVPRDVYKRLYQPKRKEKVSEMGWIIKLRSRKN